MTSPFQLVKLGFTNLDALDASQPMLDEAEKKGVYKHFICDYMGTNRLDIPDGDVPSLS